MLSDFPHDFAPFLFRIIDPLIVVALVMIALSQIILVAKQLGYCKWIPDTMRKVSGKTQALLLMLGISTQTVMIPVSDIGSNCWHNCFGFSLIGDIGFATAPAMLAIGAIVVTLALRSRFPLFLTMAYGIIGFLQLAFVDKGLWCIVRSSGYLYLWPSFEFLLMVCWVVYFATMITLFFNADWSRCWLLDIDCGQPDKRSGND